MKIIFESAAFDGQPVTIAGAPEGPLAGKTASVPAWGVPPDATVLTALAGKMNSFDVNLVSVTNGLISPRDGGGTNLNLIDLEDSAVTQLTGMTSDDEPVTINVMPRRQLAGYGSGRHWMLPVDKMTGRIVFEPGRNHRDLYVTGGDHGYTKAMIAADAGVSENTITNAWLKARPVWGGSPEFALHKGIGLPLWGEITINQSFNNYNQSHWLLLERGYDYRNTSFDSGNRGYISRGASGESPLHPMLVTAYGEGEPPLINNVSAQFQNHNTATWIAFQDLNVTSCKVTSGFDWIISHVEALEKGFYVQAGGHRTIYRCAAINTSSDPDPSWTVWGGANPPAPHECGIYASNIKSLLVLESFFDQSGWRDGYNPNSNSTEWPHPPSEMAHNIYLQYDHVDTTIRRIISSRAASQGIQCRGGGLFEDVFFLDNNMIGNNVGRGKVNGVSDIDGAGNYPLVHGCVATSAGYKRAFVRQGAIARGIDLMGYDGSCIDMIIMHKANPNDPAEIAAKSTSDYAHGGLTSTLRQYWHNIRVHNWYPSQDNSDAFGISVEALNQTTIQNYAAAVMVQPEATIEGYCLWLRTLAPAARMDQLHAALDYFRTPWGLALPRRINATTCAFIPDTRISGVQWADRLNWSTKDTAGTVDGDSANLRGNAVRFGELTIEVREVDGEHGSLELSSGKMTVDMLSNLTEVKTVISGQVWIGASENVSTYRAESGRIAFTGPASGHDLIVDGQYPEVLLGPDHTISEGKNLDVCCGPQGAVGWDGTGTANLFIHGTLRFRPFGTRMSRLEVFRTGAWGLVEPSVTATVTLVAGSQVVVDTTGMAPGTYDLTGPGVTVVDQGSILAMGVMVSGGKLVVIIS